MGERKRGLGEGTDREGSGGQAEPHFCLPLTILPLLLTAI